MRRYFDILFLLVGCSDLRLIGRIFGGHQEISAHAGLRGGGRSQTLTSLYAQIPC